MKQIRSKIDDIDSKINELLDKRAELVEEIGKLKQLNNSSVFSPSRENEVLDRIIAGCKDSGCRFPMQARVNVFREIIAASRILQKQFKISYLGPQATFTHMAATKQFSESCQYSSASSISQVFREVDKERSDYGVVPIENSTEGIVTHTLDMFFDSDCKIIAEILMEVSHNLMSKEGDISDIRKIYSHPQAFAQCEMWLEEHLPMIETVELSSTAKAAEKASAEKGTAAIASAMASRIYGLNILADNIEDTKENITRFFIIGKTITKPSKDSKTSVMFSIKDRVGALHDMLFPGTYG
ncbi:bifunctional chorismate mutase/prephenate dehydratase [Elusimicrobiota bacterium]